MQGWQSIRDEALRRIQTQEWPRGGLIPTEADLATEFGCARATVNRAMQALAEDGWIIRRRRAGSRVALVPQRLARLSIPVMREEIETRGQIYGHKILASGRADPPSETRAQLDIPADVNLYHILTLHLADATPHAIEDRWVNLDLMPQIETAPLETVSANEWLVQNAPFSHGVLDYKASVASTAIAGHLGCAPGEALLTLSRQTWSDHALITAVTVHFAPEHHVRLKI